MAVRTERRYSSTNRSIIHRRYGVALSCKPYRFFLSLSPSPPPSRSSLSPSRVPGWFHSRFNAFQMIGGIADVITMKWLSSCCAHLMLLRWIHCSRARPYWESIIDHRWHHRWRERGESFVDIGTGPTPIFTSGESRFSARRWKIAREKQSRRFNLFTLRLWRGELWTTFRSSKEVSLFFRYSYLAHLERRNEKILILPL